jgi:hypothetical protein
MDLKGLKQVHKNNDKYCRCCLNLFEMLGCFSFFSKFRIIPLYLQRPSKFFLPAQNTANILIDFKKLASQKCHPKPFNSF